MNTMLLAVTMPHKQFTVRAPKPRTFEEFCKQFTDTPLPYVVKIGKRYFYDPQGLLTKIPEHWDVFSVGIYLGEFRQQFFATSALIDLLSEHTTHTVVINEKAAWLYVCGRDVLMHGVIEHDDTAKEHPVIVRDQRKHVLGFGKTMGVFDGMMKNKLYVKNLLDRGEYLRRER